MAREIMVNLRCAQEGCDEVSFAIASNRADAARYEAKTWKCTRHNAGEKLLTITNRSSTTELTAKDWEHGRAWDEIRNGMTRGDGYLAFARDFPHGTKLRVTAEIILPDEPTQANGLGDKP